MERPGSVLGLRVFHRPGKGAPAGERLLVSFSSTARCSYDARTNPTNALSFFLSFCSQNSILLPGTTGFLTSLIKEKPVFVLETEEVTRQGRQRNETDEITFPARHVLIGFVIIFFQTLKKKKPKCIPGIFRLAI